MNAYIIWLKNYFFPNGDVPSGIEADNYFELGLINSLGIIDLIEKIESHFNIQFDDAHFQDRRFSTIVGLSEIIFDLHGRETQDNKQI